MLRKNVAGQYLYFALVNATTGAALTGATVTARRSIDGSAQAACTGTVSEPGNGQYQIALSQADTNGNNIGYLFTATNAIPVSITATLTAADPTDAASFGITRIDAAITSRMATYTQPAGFLAATFPSGTIANTTNITAGTITTVTNLTNLPSIPANWLTAAGIAAGALNGKGDWNIGKTGYALTPGTGLGNQTADITGTITTATNLTNLPSIPANWITAAGIAAGALNGKGDWNIGKTGYALSTTGNEAAADALLTRTISGGANGGRDVTSALRFIRNRWAVVTGTLTVYQEDDTTPAWTAAVTGSPGADPIVGTDPT